ncbi:MAG TPA: DinB family protein [Roseiflexaceae bacterium]|nr:DinB family protein [Roseiflexaceae bacterium]
MAETSPKSQELARELETATAGLLAALESCSAEQWRADVPNEARSVGTMAHHIAAAAPMVANWAEQIAAGATPPITLEMVHAGNAQHAAEFPNPDKAATLDLLRSNTAIAAGIVRGFSEEQLARSVPMEMFGGQPVSAQMLIEIVLIGHIRGQSHSHLPNIEAAL